MQRRIFTDEFLARVKNSNFDSILLTKKPEYEKTFMEPQALQDMKRNYQGGIDYTLKPAINVNDSDPKRVLGKLEKILSDLMNSPALRIYFALEGNNSTRRLNT